MFRKSFLIFSIAIFLFVTFGCTTITTLVTTPTPTQSPESIYSKNILPVYIKIEMWIEGPLREWGELDQYYSISKSTGEKKSIWETLSLMYLAGMKPSEFSYPEDRVYSQNVSSNSASTTFGEVFVLMENVLRDNTDQTYNLLNDFSRIAPPQEIGFVHNEINQCVADMYNLYTDLLNFFVVGGELTNTNISRLNTCNRLKENLAELNYYIIENYN